jgi:hypothetical protein
MHDTSYVSRSATPRLPTRDTPRTMQGVNYTSAPTSNRSHRLNTPAETPDPAIRLVDAYLTQVEQEHIAYLLQKVPPHLRPSLLAPFL